MKRSIVFISYSWDSENHKEWVLQLANDLIVKGGIEIFLDQYELSAGRELTHFMEKSIEKSDKVLIILTPMYKKKADDRTGGVGFEYSMISQGLFEVQSKNNKFIPILKDGSLNESAPTYLKSKIYHSMQNKKTYHPDLFALIRLIYEKHKLVKPALGNIPDFTSMDYDPIIDQANEISKNEKINNEINLLLDSQEGVRMAINEVENLFNQFTDKAKKYSDKTEFKFKVEKENCNKLILSCYSYSVFFEWTVEYSNSLSNSKLIVSYWLGHLVLTPYNKLYIPGQEPKRVKSQELSFDLDLDKKSVWKSPTKSKITSIDIIKDAFSFIMEKIDEEKSKNFRMNQ
jgi:hypothetical protein